MKDYEQLYRLYIECHEITGLQSIWPVHTSPPGSHGLQRLFEAAMTKVIYMNYQFDLKGFQQ